MNDILAEQGCAFRIEARRVVKNGIEYDGIAIYSDGYNTQTVFYPDSDFWELSPDGQVDAMTNIYSRCMRNFDTDIFTKDYVLGHVYPKLQSNKGRRLAKREGVVFRDYLDMLVEYLVIVPSMDGMKAGFTLHQEHLDSLGISAEDISHRSLANLYGETRLFQMSSVLQDMGMTDDIHLNVYILTNNASYYGAAAILCHNRLFELGDILGEPFIILPSSVHEVLAIPSATAADLNQLTDIVREVNASVVAPDDRLTDSVYICEKGYISYSIGVKDKV